MNENSLLIDSLKVKTHWLWLWRVSLLHSNLFRKEMPWCVCVCFQALANTQLEQECVSRCLWLCSCTVQCDTPCDIINR